MTPEEENSLLNKINRSNSANPSKEEKQQQEKQIELAKILNKKVDG
jgi:hypothetical protein